MNEKKNITEWLLSVGKASSRQKDKFGIQCDRCHTGRVTDDEPDPIEGHKLSTYRNCQFCDGHGVRWDMEYVKSKYEEYVSEIDKIHVEEEKNRLIFASICSKITTEEYAFLHKKGFKLP